MMQADLEESEPTWLECRFEDSALKLTHLKKSRLKQSDDFEDCSLELTRLEKSWLDQSGMLQHYSSKLTQKEKSQLD